jgi:hypothetical protein
MRRWRRPAPKPYEIAIDEFYSGNDKCLWNGYLEEQVDEVGAFIPSQGKVEDPNLPKLEEFRKLQNVYYDVYNNGGCNCVSMNEDTPEYRERWGMSKATMSRLRRHPDKLEARMQKLLGEARRELIEAGMLDVA